MAFASLKPSQAVHGGLIDDMPATVIGAAMDYKEVAKKDGSIWNFFGAILTIEDEEGQQSQVLWQVGNHEKWAPDAEKRRAQPKNDDGKAVIYDSADIMVALTELKNAGFPEDKIDDDITFLVGGKYHFKQVPARGGSDSGEQQRKRTVLAPVKILRAPWEAEKKAGGAKAGAKAAGKPDTAAAPGKPASSTPAVADDSIKEAASNILMTLLTQDEWGDGIPKSKVVAAARGLGLLDTDDVKDRKSAVSRALLTDDVIGSLEGFTLDKGVIKLG